jgi:signal transduction histidine kinase
MAEIPRSDAGAPGTARVPWPRRDVLAADRRIRYAAGLGLLVALYYGAAHLGYALEFAGPVAAVVWLPVGVGIAFLYLAGLQFWPGVVIGDLLVNNYAALAIGPALGQTLGNLLEVVVATLLLERLARLPSLRGAVGTVGRLLIAIAVGTAISATIGSLSLRLGGVISAAAHPEVWRTWWLGDFSGALLVVPLALAWIRRSSSPPARRVLLEGALAVGAVVVLSEVAWSINPPLEYIVFPALIWSGFRLGPRGATLAVFVAAGYAVWATTHYAGPFHVHSLSRRVLETQAYIVLASLSAQVLAAVVRERETFARRLWASRARLVWASDTERRRLYRNLHDGAQQRLAGLMVRLDLASEAAEDAPAATRGALHSARAELALAIDDLRELAHGDHPALLTEQGLAAALLDMAGRSPIPTEVRGLPAGRAPEVAETTAYYVIAEAMTNAQKYARASTIGILAETSGGLLHVEVQDDGAGGAVETQGSGLEGLRDRVEAVGGRLDVHSSADGTRISAAIPTDPVRSHARSAR